MLNLFLRYFQKYLGIRQHINGLTLMLLLANFAFIQNDAKNLKIPETLAHGYSSESTQQELSNEYQHEMV